MPPRIPRSSVSAVKPQTARKKSQKRNLEALSIASHTAGDRTKIRQHRLGAAEDDTPRRKRQRLEEDEDDLGEDQASSARRLQQKSLKKGRFDELDIEEGSDSEGNEWRMGHVDNEDDSDLDSDEAFGSSDEEKFEGFTFRGSSGGAKGKKQKKRLNKTISGASEIDLDEVNGNNVDEDDEDDDDLDDDDLDDDDLGDDAVDLATMLDQSEYSEHESKRKAGKRPGLQESETDSDGHASSEEGSEDETSDTSMPDDENSDEDPSKLTQLQDLIASLEPQPTTTSKKAHTVDVYESLVPSDFGHTSSQKLTVDDLRAATSDPSLRKSLKLLEQSSSTKQVPKRTGVARKLDAPLPKRQQDRLDRAAANQKANETLERWKDTVIHNRRAEHLSFPLQDPSAAEPQGVTKFVPTLESKPANELESTIQSILQESGFSTSKGKTEEDQIRAFEELATKKMPLEEVQARRAELKKARELLFREEVRAKRVKKIKSKSYRRVHRREREKVAQNEKDAFAAAGIDISEDEREQNERRRAEERMGAKHREGKWAKSVHQSGRAAWDEDARAGVTEMARRNEELRRRIEGKEVHAEDEEGTTDISSDESEDDSLSDGEGNASSEDKRLSRQLAKLNRSASEGGESKLSSMMFMKRAEAARKAQNDEDIERMRRELAGEETASDNEQETSMGRKLFGPKPTAAINPAITQKGSEFEERSGSDNEDRNSEDGVNIVVDKADSTSKDPTPKPRSIFKKPQKIAKRQPAPSTDDANNPWLSRSTKNGTHAVDVQDSVQADVLRIDRLDRSTPPRTKPAQSRHVTTTECTAPTDADGWTTVTYAKDGVEYADGEDDYDAESHLPFVLRNQELVRRGFAGDEAVTDFEAEKKAAIAEEDDKITDNTLPGWGSWTGEGLSKAAKRAQNRQKGRFTTTEEGIKPETRKDRKLGNVIINEGRVKKNAKYLASQLPHQYENRQQYERALRLPIGPEWTTKETFQNATKPRVLVKQGIIAPMERPLL
ncbi:hypothetical protein B0A49_03339 [Cryomyces minteri]|uniref:Utp14-domain-containing protein n=1 Tax=Cryomyces minteri TaxID=331657 RepID=A0A4U0XMH3_9PEZI|nr:hypothetical protein B0A49_03602 [Cryomyces minteri]TKA79400.1 hypothetical protein B0A49_03339 [Cryomyces minteri]